MTIDSIDLNVMMNLILTILSNLGTFEVETAEAENKEEEARELTDTQQQPTVRGQLGTTENQLLVMLFVFGK